MILQKIKIILFAIILILFLSSTLAVSAQMPPGMQNPDMKQISGKYTNSKWAIEFVIPEGYAGLEMQQQDMLMVMISPDYTSDTQQYDVQHSMMVYAIKNVAGTAYSFEEYAKNVEKFATNPYYGQGDCKGGNSSTQEINGQKFVTFNVECTIPEGKWHMKWYATDVAGTTYMLVEYASGTGNVSIEKIDELVKTVKVGTSDSTIETMKETESVTATITVKTDKSQYEYGDTITFSGVVSPVVEGVPVYFNIQDAYGEGYALYDTLPDKDGTYSYSVKIGLHVKPQTLTVKTMYGLMVDKNTKITYLGDKADTVEKDVKKETESVTVGPNGTATVGDGGTATAPLLSGAQVSITLPAGKSGTVTISTTTAKTTSPEDGTTISFAAEVVDIIPPAGACATGCAISFEASQTQLDTAGIALADVRIFHDTNSDDDFADANEIIKPTMTNLGGGLFKFSTNIPFTSKFAIGGIRALFIAGETTSQETKSPAVTTENAPTKKNGCLIATAAFGSEMAPQVQQLRETRDNIVMKTQSGTAFMTAFNSVYYSFAPTVADWERQNPIFKEMVKTTITPLITTLSILSYVDIDSEPKMIGYGIGVILLNVGMYFVAPAFVIMKLKHKKF